MIVCDCESGALGGRSGERVELLLQYFRETPPFVSSRADKDCLHAAPHLSRNPILRADLPHRVSCC